MGIHINLAVLLQDWLTRHHVKGPVVTLGVQDTTFTWEQFKLAIEPVRLKESGYSSIDAKGFFACLGLEPTTALDVSDFEGAEIIYDLNSEDPPQELINSAGLVFNGGTLEHVFHVPNAISTLSQIAHSGGYIMHVMPCNNWVNHGFYQFSPTFIFDYYASQGNTVVEAALASFDPLVNSDRWQIKPVSSDLGHLTGPNSLGGRTFLLCALIRIDRKGKPRMPTQSYYSKSEAYDHMTRWFPRFELNHGSRIEYQNRAIVPLRSFAPSDGLMWAADAPDFEFLADTIEWPQRSPAILLEDTHALGPAHSLHNDIVRLGKGRFSHWNDRIMFSTRDGSIPGENGRDYMLVIPHPYTGS